MRACAFWISSVCLSMILSPSYAMVIDDLAVFHPRVHSPIANSAKAVRVQKQLSMQPRPTAQHSLRDVSSRHSPLHEAEEANQIALRTAALANYSHSRSHRSRRQFLPVERERNQRREEHLSNRLRQKGRPMRGVVTHTRAHTHSRSHTHTHNAKRVRLVA